MNFKIICRTALFSVLACVLVSISEAGFISAEETDETIKTYTYAVRGDLNGDEKVDVFDLIRYKRDYLFNPEPTDIHYGTDINMDNKVDTEDVMTVSRHILGNKRLWSEKDMPVMDGSTSAIPLETGIKSELLGIPYREAGELVSHNKTHESFSRLLNGENDMIFTVPISESQQEEADKAGVHLNFTPVAKEGFVFIVNSSNPVDSLTQQQLKDIYAGRIKNWKEVGGYDQPIIAYQRNGNSGSQNYIKEFMKDDTLAAAPVESQIATMGGLIDRIAIYDNSVRAIGYSVYTYAAQMYENRSDIKFIAVDGIAPSKETMADSSYPLMSNTYIMYKDDASENTMEFIRWAESDEGQKCVLANGYLPVEDMEFPEGMKLYSQNGTGKEMPENYVPSRKYSVFTYSDRNDPDRLSGTTLCFHVDFLKDKNLERQINKEIYDICSPYFTEGAGLAYVNDCSMRCYAENGYLSIEIAFRDRTYFLNYNLINSKKIEKFSDLFFRDVRFIDEINRIVETNLPVIPKTDFPGLTGNADSFSISRIIVNSENPAVEKDMLVEYGKTYFKDNLWDEENQNDIFLPKYMVTGEYYDMKQVITGFVSEYERPEWFTGYCVSDINYFRNIYYNQITGSLFHSDEEVENMRKTYEKIYEYAEEEIDSILFQKGPDGLSISFITTFGELYMTVVKTMNVSNSDEKKYDFNLFRVTFNHSYLSDFYDTETGERVYPADIFGDCAEEILSLTSIIDIDFDKNVIIYRDASGDDFCVEFDPDKINSKYLVRY